MARTTGNGRPVAIFPGLSPTNEVVFGWQARLELGFYKPLAQQHEVHIVNRASGLPEGVTIMDMADDYAQALRGLTPKPVPVIGISTGGAIAIAFAIRYPSMVERLVLIATGHTLSTIGRRASLEAARLAECGQPRRSQMALAPAMVRPGPLQKLMRWALFAGASAAGITRNWDWRDMVRTLRAEAAFNTVSQLEGIVAPTLIIAGAEDPAYPPATARLMERRIPNSRCLIYPGGHTGVLRAKRLWRDVLEFLDEPIERESQVSALP